MQKHKKYLVVTIWISTIAFVGAGFVGWGAYKFGSSGDVIAKVGDIKITLKEFQDYYSTLYESYARMYGGNFDQQKAKELGLQKQVLDTLVTEALLLNLAKDLGLTVLDEEVVAKIASLPEFQKNGKFDKELYLTLLKRNHIKPVDFERGVRKDLLYEKLQNALKTPVFDLEFNTVAGSMYIGDKLEYKILTSRDINLTYSPQEVKDYYEKNKENYKSQTKYTLSVIEVSPQEVEVDSEELKNYYNKYRTKYKGKDGKILPFEEARELVEQDYRLKEAKKEALRRYVKFKKGELSAQKTLELSEEEVAPQLLERLKLADVGKVFKPFLDKERYLVVKLEKVTPPIVLPFEKVKERVEEEFKRKKMAKLLVQKAKEELEKGFKGKVTDYVCGDDFMALSDDLTPSEAITFFSQLFLDTKPKGFVPVALDRIVLYKILDQKLGYKPKVDKNQALITDNSDKLKTDIQTQNLIQVLQSLYQIKLLKGI